MIAWMLGAFAGIAHYDLRLAELFTPPASHGCSIRPCARTCA